MELSDGLIHAFGCVPEYQQGLPTGLAYQVLMRIDPISGQTVSKTLLGKRIMFACNDNISFFIIGDVVYVMTHDLLYAFNIRGISWGKRFDFSLCLCYKEHG